MLDWCRNIKVEPGLGSGQRKVPRTPLKRSAGDHVEQRPGQSARRSFSGHGSAASPLVLDLDDEPCQSTSRSRDKAGSHASEFSKPNKLVPQPQRRTPSSFPHRDTSTTPSLLNGSKTATNGWKSTSLEHAQHNSKDDSHSEDNLQAIARRKTAQDAQSRTISASCPNAAIESRLKDQNHPHTLHQSPNIDPAHDQYQHSRLNAPATRSLSSVTGLDNHTANKAKVLPIEYDTTQSSFTPNHSAAGPSPITSTRAITTPSINTMIASISTSKPGEDNEMKLLMAYQQRLTDIKRRRKEKAARDKAQAEEQEERRKEEQEEEKKKRRKQEEEKEKKKRQSQELHQQKEQRRILESAQNDPLAHGEDCGRHDHRTTPQKTQQGSPVNGSHLTGNGRPSVHDRARARAENDRPSHEIYFGPPDFRQLPSKQTNAEALKARGMADAQARIDSFVKAGERSEIEMVGKDQAAALLPTNPGGSQRPGGLLELIRQQNGGVNTDNSGSPGLNAAQSTVAATPKTKVKLNDYSNQPIDLQKVTQDDWLLFQLRHKGYSSVEIREMWPTISGSTVRALDWFRKRYVRMQKTFPDLVPAGVLYATETSNPDLKKRNTEIAAKLKAGEDVKNLLAGQDGDTARAETRREALDHAPKRADGRASIGGKTVPKEMTDYVRYMLEQHDDADNELLDNAPAKHRAPSPPANDDMIHFAFRVMRRTVRVNQSEDEVEWYQCFDAYDSLLAANAAAFDEMTLERDAIGIWPLHEWHMSVNPLTGLVTWSGKCARGAVDIKVKRFGRSLQDGVLPKCKDNWIERQVFEVIEKRTTVRQIEAWADGEMDEEMDEEMEDDPEPVANVASFTEELQRLFEESDDDLVTSFGEQTPQDTATTSQHTSADSTQSSSDGEMVDADGEKEGSQASIQHSQPNGASSLAKEADQDGKFSPSKGASDAPNVPRTIRRIKHATQTTEISTTSVGSIFGSRDRANHSAGSHLLKIQRELDPNREAQRPSMDNMAKWKRQQDEMREYCDHLGEEKSFNHTLEVDMEGAEPVDHPDGKLVELKAEVWVEERRFENPRNLL